MKVALTIVLNLLISTTSFGVETAEFVSLFDGKTLDGWEGAVDSYAAEDGILICREGAVGKLLTTREFEDFHLKFDFLLTPGANNGLAIRSPLDGDGAYAGMELQIIDNTTKKYGDLLDYQYHGSLYGVAPARRGVQKPVGEWNEQEVLCQGRHITVVLNGSEILDIDIDKVAPNGETIDHKDHPGLARKSGRIGFLSHGDRVSFRNIRIQNLSDAEN
ncbi:3-keto-disaccharide hydrolase [Bythopirellula polymerisocia]|uniref:3-keto-alpha-glucoside-1,2-lyase/3-keto-2-hydroxy-glucal hydratase domain-containing protein n=1 Tax=Bythopirellula polymerisocia TaxID=2528003 RepID=A0A5C6C2Y4_9BACT|nr:DUF1080 domain-containing protein [Bythopirellula polymerisocia]TWU17614.1 hypothetical protein Pla144_50830 [Bythopirellula polymerisocia]